MANFGTIVSNIGQFVPDLSEIVIKQRVNYRYQQIMKLRDWEYLKDNITTGTSMIVSTGSSCKVSYQGTSIISRDQSGTSFYAHHVGWWMRFGAEPQPYEISAVTDTSRLTIKSPYSGNSNGLTGTSFTLFKAIYRTAVSMSHIYSIVYQSPLEEISQSRLLRMDPEMTSTGEPTMYCVVERSRHQGRVKYQLWPTASSAPYNIRVYYKKLVADLSASTEVPLCSTELLEAWALYDCYKLAIIKNPNYGKLLTVQAQELGAIRAEEIDSDLETTSLPDKVLDSAGATIMNDDYALDHDTEGW